MEWTGKIDWKLGHIFDSIIVKIFEFWPSFFCAVMFRAFVIFGPLLRF